MVVRSSRPAVRRVAASHRTEQDDGAHIPALGGARKVPTQTRSRETVAAILEAASCLLVETGYRAASTNAIARRAGVSIGSLYQFFDSREDIFRTLLARHAAEIHACAASALEPVARGHRAPAEVLPGLVRTLLDRHRDQPELARAMARELAHLDTEALRGPEAADREGPVALVAARLSGDHREVRSWMAAEITAHLTRRLAHDPPPGLDTEAVLAVYADLMEHLLS